MNTANQEMLKELAFRKKLKDNFTFFSSRILKILTKDKHVLPLILNSAQLILAEAMDAQFKRCGRNRILILKGRQQGISTYIAGRFYHDTIHNYGTNTFILSHDADATANLFGMVERFYAHTPKELKPSCGASNRRELYFDKLDSGYHVGTAGNKGVGRSRTVTNLHGSEVAFWENAEEHLAGIMQAVPDGAGTRIVFETTANGCGNLFYQYWMEAKAGYGDFLPVFIPWFVQKEYRRSVPVDFVLTDREESIKEIYDLDNAQIYWRRKKIEELKSEARFKQEYPCNPDEAFQFSKTESLIDTEYVLKARKTQPDMAYTATRIVAGFDPSMNEGTGDKDAFIYRAGRRAFGLDYRNFPDNESRYRYVEARLRSHSPYIDMLYIDFGGGGYAIWDRLCHNGYSSRVRLINFAANADNKNVYYNKRAEMWGRMQVWLYDEAIPAIIPDDDGLHGDLVAPGFKTNGGRLQLEGKAEIRTRLKRSTDRGDALCLTFADDEPLVKNVHSIIDRMRSNQVKKNYNPMYREGMM